MLSGIYSFPSSRGSLPPKSTECTGCTMPVPKPNTSTCAYSHAYLWKYLTTWLSIWRNRVYELDDSHLEFTHSSNWSLWPWELRECLHVALLAATAEHGVQSHTLGIPANTSLRWFSSKTKATSKTALVKYRGNSRIRGLQSLSYQLFRLQ